MNYYKPPDINKELWLRKFGENVKARRLEKRFSLRQVHFKSNLDPSKIAKIEKGQVNITLTTLLVLTKALKTNPNALLDFEVS